MRILRQSLYVLPLVALLFLSPALAWGEHATATGDKSHDQSSELSMSGSLKSVDPETKKLVITSAEGTDTEFTYDEHTTIMGAQSTIEGLSTSSGAQVNVFYRDDNGQKKAVRIEVQASQDSQGMQPTPDPTPDQPQPDQPQSPEPNPGQNPEPLPGTPPGA